MPASPNAKAQMLDVALALFNEQGSGEVTTNQIAQAAGRSPGNLYYHFSDKEEIVRLLLQRLIERWWHIYALPNDRDPDLADLERMLAGNFEALWHYRFIYRDLPTLLRRDREFRDMYHAARADGFANLRRLLEQFVHGGVLRPFASIDEADELGQLLWIVGDFYLAFTEAGGVEPSKDQINNGIALFRRVLKPYLRT
jgi:AcrR family transcriptional regulator